MRVSPPARGLRSSDVSAPRKYLCFRPGRFRFFDVAVAIVEKRQARPPDLIVRAQLRRALPRLDRLRETPKFHQRHSERVPAIEKLWIHLDATPIFFHRTFQLTDGEVA